MVRDKRASDNHALITAQKIALKNKASLIVCFQYVGEFKKANLRQYEFLFKGLEETSNNLSNLNIDFHLLQGPAEDVIPKIINQLSVGSIVTDYSPLKVYKKRLKKVLDKITIPVCQVDSHNIVPVWVASEKKEFAAHTIRKKIHKRLDEYLTDIPELVTHPYNPKNKSESISWSSLYKNLTIDSKITSVSWMQPGEEKAKERLNYLLKH